MRVDFVTDPGVASDTLVIGFSSYGDHGRPVAQNGYEWRYFLQDRFCHRAFLIDCHQHWYLGSILGFSRNLLDTRDLLARHVESTGARRVITMGSSMGAFAALLVGGLLGAELAIAFAPQTNMCQPWLDELHDHRWKLKSSEMNAIGYEHLDLLPLFSDGVRPAASHIYFDETYHDEDSEWDLRHAQRLEAQRGVELRPTGYGHHAVAYEMAKRGDLSRLMDKLIG